MATNPLGGLGPRQQDSLPGSTPERTKTAARPQDGERADAKGPQTTPVDAAAGEKVQISKEARDLLELTDLMSAARKSLDESPDIRADRVREVKERLKSGVYETKGIQDELAHRLASILRDAPLSDG